MGLSCSLLTLNSRPAKKTNLSPCLSCDCLVDEDSQGRSPSRTRSNHRTFLSSTSIPVESETISVYDDSSTDIWLSDLQSKFSSKTIYDEFDSIPFSRLNSSTEDGRLDENVKRNRFADVIPYDDTRVRLIPTKTNLHGYINASHVKIRIENTIYSYIASQSPLTTTIDDFWRMISGSNVHVIVMLLESSNPHCAAYFPRNSNENFRTEDFQIDLISEQNQNDFLIRQFRMTHIQGQRKRTLVHLQYTSWDENQLPLNTLSFIDFINVANSYRRHYGETNPCLVHCTAGIGRTGIFILMHLMIQCITFNKKVNIASVLRVMREHRMSLIDRTYAYVFVYRCLIDYLKSSRLI